METQATELKVSGNRSRRRARNRSRRGGRHLAARALLAIVMALGSVVLCTVIPFGWLRLSASLSDRYTTVYLLALFGGPVAMVLWGWGLIRVNRVYLRLADPARGVDRGSRMRGAHRRGERRLTLLEVMVIASAIIALILLIVWWLALAHPPTSTPWPDEFSGGSA